MNKMGQEVCFEMNFVSTSLCYKDEISNKVKFSTLFYRLCRLKACTMFSPPNRS